MKSIALEVIGDPVGQPRPRFANGRVYRDDDHPVHAWKSAIRGAIADLRAAKPIGPPIGGPCRVDIEFWMPRPQRLLGKKAEHGAVPHVAKPDLDNLVKACLDAIQSTDSPVPGLIERDELVWCGAYSKAYAPLGAKPGCTIIVSVPEAPDISGG